METAVVAVCVNSFYCTNSSRSSSSGWKKRRSLQRKGRPNEEHLREDENPKRNFCPESKGATLYFSFREHKVTNKEGPQSQDFRSFYSCNKTIINSESSLSPRLKPHCINATGVKLTIHTQNQPVAFFFS